VSLRGIYSRFPGQQDSGAEQRQGTGRVECDRRQKSIGNGSRPRSKIAQQRDQTGNDDAGGRPGDGAMHAPIGNAVSAPAIATNAVALMGDIRPRNRL